MYLLAVVITLAISVLPSEAREIKKWATKTPAERSWEKPNGYVYAVGTCRFLEDYTTEQFLVYQQIATEKAIVQLKKRLKVDKIKGFQIIDFEYVSEQAKSQIHTDQKLTDYVVYYVLAAAPKAKNKKKMVSTKAPPPGQKVPEKRLLPEAPIPPTMPVENKNLQLVTNTIIKGLVAKGASVSVENNEIQMNGKRLDIGVYVEGNEKDKYGFYNAYASLIVTVYNQDNTFNKVIMEKGKAAHINVMRSRENAIIKAAEKAVTKLLE